MPLALGMLIASPLAGGYADRHGSRGLAVLGMLVTACGLAAMTTLQVHSPYWSGDLAGARRRRLGHVQQPEHRRDDGRRAAQRRGDRRAARVMLQNTGAVLSIALMLAIVTAAVPTLRCFRSSRA